MIRLLALWMGFTTMAGARAYVGSAIMELTKIPLATACYYAAKWTWRTIFIVALIAVNYSTFETIIQGFELG